MPATLSDLVDQLILQYVSRVQGRGYVSHDLSRSESVDAISDLVSDVGSDEYHLLQAFDESRRYWRSQPVSEWVNPGTVSGEIDNGR